jgi:hypothetical protein
MFFFNRRRSRDATRLSALKTHRGMWCFFFAVALTGSMGTAHAVECQSEKGAGYPWAWREIDGKRCWYKGKPGMDKKLLRWAESPSAAAAPKSTPKSTPKDAAKNALKGAPKGTPKSTPKRAPSLITDYAEREVLLHSYWPPLPPSNVVNDRTGAARAR